MLLVPCRFSLRVFVSSAYLLSVAVVSLLSPAAHAQPTLKTLSYNLNDTYGGVMQASDGNFYTTSIITARVAIPYSCEANANDTCSYITKIAPDGTATIFHTFYQISGQSNVDGMSPNPIIEASDGNFYGSTLNGGAGDLGTIFKITPSGVFTVIFTFTHQYVNGVETSLPYGADPGPLVEGSDGFLYGTTQFGGPAGSDYGTIFKVSKTGDMTVLHEFVGSRSGDPRNFPDGLLPISLIQGADGNFYGTTLQSPNDIKGNFTGQGTIFSITPSGTFTTLHNFAVDGSDGVQPFGPLTQGPDGNFYGANKAYGYYGTPDASAITDLPNTFHTNGNFYKMSSTGNYQVLYTFTGQADGRDPSPFLTLGSDGNFYGAARYAGSNNGCAPFSGCGVLFQMQPSGKETVLYSFLGTTDSGIPFGRLVQANDGSFYGTNEIGLTGTQNYVPGSFFNLALKPALAAPIQLSFSRNGVAFDPTKTTIDANTPLVLTWNVLNAYSDTARNCHAVVQGGASGAGNWSGMQFGTVTASGYSGSATITPTSGGSFTYALTCGGTESGFITLNVGGGPLKILTTDTTLKSATVGVHYLQALVGAGGTQPYSWAITSNNLPKGLSLDPVNGTISGTPTEATDVALTIQLTDSSSTPVKVTSVVIFDVNPAISVASVEFTQSIQVYQALADLKATISAKGETPVPVISGKPAVMRIYFEAVTDATVVTLQVTGVVNQTRTVSLQPGCSAQDQRNHSNGCPSVDLYFTPPSGSWSADIVLTNVFGDQLQHETLNSKSRDTAGIHLLGTSVCDSFTTSSGGSIRWSCGDPTNLIGRTALLAAMMPTTNVTLDLTPDRVTNVAFTHFLPLQADYDTWLSRSVAQVAQLYTQNNIANVAADQAANTYSVRFGIYRHNLDGSSTPYDTGMANNIPGRGAISADFTSRLGIDASASVVAHETGHTLGLKHTRIPVAIVAAPPGCYNRAEDDTSQWPFNSVNIQSSTGQEYPFNVGTGAILDPNQTFDLMSYCYPRWVVPLDFDNVTQTLTGGTVAGPFLQPITGANARLIQPLATAAPSSSGPYWFVSGTVATTGVIFDPIFQDTVIGTTAAGAGTYSIEEQNPAGQSLYTRFFTPVSSQSDVASGAEITSSPTFGESIPVTSGVTTIVVKNSTGATVGQVALASSGPVVAISSPAAGFNGSGIQTVSWTATNPAAGVLTSRVLYSSNSGATWSQLAQFQGTGLDVDFTTLPGTNAATALIKVMVSDGANTGVAISPAFSVTRKIPTVVTIVAPVAGVIHPAADPLLLIGAGYDPDDRMLAGTSLVWTSNIQGKLGIGSPLSVSLLPGNHILTLTATDSDGNAISTTVAVTITGAGPTLSLTTAPGTTNCTNATITAAPGIMGASLAIVQYSLNGGKTYVNIPLSSLPYTLAVPGTGSINLVARAADASGQSTAQSTRLTLINACPQSTQVTPTITWPTPAAIAFGTALSATQLNASASVSGTFTYSPAIGTVPSVGTQQLTVSFIPTDVVNYTAASSATTLSVTPVSLLVTPGNATRAYGVSNPSFTYTASGFVHGDTTSVLTGAPSLTTTATVASAPGTYAINATTGTLTSTNYTYTFGLGTLTVTQAASATTVKASASTIVAGSSETLTVTVVSAGTGTPTGTVTFLEGSTSLGSSTLTAGTATLTTSALTTGTHNLSINYAGDVNFLASQTSTSILVTAAIPLDFTFTSTGTTTQTVKSGQPAAWNFALAPTATAYPASVTFAVTGLPTGATATFTPTTVPASGAAQTVTLTVQTPTRAGLDNSQTPKPTNSSPAPFVLAFFSFPLLLSRRIRRAATQRLSLTFMLIVALSALTLTALSGCGQSGAFVVPQTSTLTVTATSGATQHTATVTLISQ